MSKDVYHEMFLHVTWHTKESRNLICRDMEKTLHDLIRTRALSPGGVYVHELGGTENHVHLVARVRPTLPIPQWVGQVKGGSSHDLGHGGRWQIDWQSGYGVVTFGMKDLDWIKQYVQNQKEHHRRGTIFDRLERISGDEEEE